MCWACGASGVRPWACTSMCWIFWLRILAVAQPVAPELLSSSSSALRVTVLSAPLPAGCGWAEAEPVPRDAAATSASTEVPRKAVLLRFMFAPEVCDQGDDLGGLLLFDAARPSDW